MSLAACEERCARLRTSEATTAKPRPASPARAASTAGIEREQVGLAGDLVDDADDVGDLARTTPRSATSRRPPAPPPRRRDRQLRWCWRLSVLACWAFSAFFFTVAEISSIEAEVFSRLAACSSVRCDRSVVPAEISRGALATSPVPPLIWDTMVVSFSAMPLASSLSCPKVP